MLQAGSDINTLINKQRQGKGHPGSSQVRLLQPLAHRLYMYFRCACTYGQIVPLAGSPAADYSGGSQDWQQSCATGTGHWAVPVAGLCCPQTGRGCCQAAQAQAAVTVKLALDCPFKFPQFWDA